MLDFREARARRLYIALVAAFAAVVITAVAYTLLRLRNEEVDHHYKIAALQARALEDYLTQTFHNIDLTLQNVSEEAATPERANHAFAAAVRHAPYLRSISLLDSSQRIVASSNPLNVGIQVAVSEFLPPAAPPSELLRVGPPWLGRDFGEGQPTTPEQPAAGNALTFLPILRTVTLHDRSVILLATVNPDYFLNYFGQQQGSGGSIVRVLRYDGTLLLSTHEEDTPGARREPPQGGTTASGAGLNEIRNGQPNFGAFRASRNFPFSVFTYRSRDAALDEWRDEGRLMVTIVALSLAAVLALAALLYRRLRRAAREEAETERRLHLAAKVFEVSAEGILIATADRVIASVNPAFTEITGYSAEDVVGRNPRLLASGQHDRAFYERMWQAIAAHGQWQGEIINRRKNGVIYPEWLTITQVRDDSGRVSHYVAVFSDITERKASESRVRYLSEHDFLTGLSNRFLFQDRVSQAIAHCVRGGGRLAILFLDLDHFKAVNDRFGHEVGDLLLRQVAERLRVCVRASDTICRQGGDEFLILVEAIDHPEDGAQVAEKLIERISEPCTIHGHEIVVTPSIGIALYPDDGSDTPSLVRAADTAMYQAKEHGRKTYRYFGRSMNTAHGERIALEEAMRRSLAQGELQLHYQPVVAIPSDGIVGVEALLRWTHPELGPVSPLRFIPVAEESTLIVALGDWVLREGCRQAADWGATGLPPLVLAINVSQQQFVNGDFVARVERILRETGVPAARLQFDIAEADLVAQLERDRAPVERLRALGVGIAVDNFGTLPDSLSRLHKLPVDKLKVDRSLVRDVLLDEGDATLVSTIVRMARSIGLRVVAEGVENAETWDFFRALGCDEAQGFHFSRAVPASELTALLRRHGGRLRRIA